MYEPMGASLIKVPQNPKIQSGYSKEKKIWIYELDNFSKLEDYW